MHSGNLVDVRLSLTTDMDGTKAFFAQAAKLHGDNIPDKVATDGLISYARAIEEELGKDVEQSCQGSQTGRGKARTTKGKI